MAVRMMCDGGDAGTVFTRLSVARLANRTGVMQRVMAAVRDHAMERSVMRMTRVRRGEIGLDGRRRNRIGVFQIGKILVLFLMNLEGSEKFGVIVARRETEMGTIIAT